MAARRRVEDGEDPLRLNRMELVILDADRTQRARHVFFTNRELTRDKVAAYIDAGRARWKIENEHNNTLGDQGLQSGAQLRARQEQSVESAVEPEPLGVPISHDARPLREFSPIQCFHQPVALLAIPLRCCFDRLVDRLRENRPAEFT